MTKSKYIEDHDRLDYKASLAEFMQTINPKDSEEILQALREKYLSARECHEPNKPSVGR